MTVNLTTNVSPGNTEEVSSALRLAHENGVCVHPCGSRSKFGWLNDGVEGMFLHLGRMHAVLEHTWQDMTCTVQAGCTWQKLQTALEEHGQQVALDALWPQRSTVGGIIAANDSGVLRLRYGGLRDLVIGMTVVLADGTVARSGGKVVKNVAGYDLPKLFCGSFGTLGVITEVTFRLHSIKQHRATLSVTSVDAGSLGRLLLQVLASNLNPESMQLRTCGDRFALDLRLAARPDVLELQAQEFRAMANCAVEAVENEAEKHPWNARERMFAGLATTDAEAAADALIQTDRIAFKATVLPSEIAAFVRGVADLGGEAVAQATGIVTGWVSRHQEDDVRRVRAKAEVSGGSLTALHLPPDSRFERWGTLPPSLPLMRAVKHNFDPHRLLNPGRYLGGI